MLARSRMIPSAEMEDGSCFIISPKPKPSRRDHSGNPVEEALQGLMAVSAEQFEKHLEDGKDDVIRKLSTLKWRRKGEDMRFRYYEAYDVDDCTRLTFCVDPKVVGINPASSVRRSEEPLHKFDTNLNGVTHILRIATLTGSVHVDITDRTACNWVFNVSHANSQEAVKLKIVADLKKGRDNERKRRT